jgi:hypothetical protein
MARETSWRLSLRWQAVHVALPFRDKATKSAPCATLHAAHRKVTNVRPGTMGVEMFSTT